VFVTLKGLPCLFDSLETRFGIMFMLRPWYKAVGVLSLRLADPAESSEVIQCGMFIGRLAWHLYVCSSR